MDNERFMIGMDLGTFKTAVASSSGVRDVVCSAVGWPKDHIARSMLGRDVVFGQDLTKHRMALDVVRPFERGLLKYDLQTEITPEQAEKHERAARLLLNHAVSRLRPPQDMPVYGVIGAPARASVTSKKFLLQAAQGAFDAAMIISEPFAIAYGMNRLSETLVIDIGAGTTDICPIYGTYPSEEEQVTLLFGGDFIDDNFYHAIRERYPEAQLTLNMAREIKEKYGFVHDVNEQAVVNLPVNGKPKPFDITEPLREACRKIVPQIIEGLQEMISGVDPEFQSVMLNNILLGGGGSQLRGLDRVIEQNLKDFGGGKVTRVGDAVFSGAVGALKLAKSMPNECWEQMSTMGYSRDVELVA